MGDHFYNLNKTIRDILPGYISPCFIFYPAIDPWKSLHWVFPLNYIHICLVFGDPMFSEDLSPLFYADPTCNILFWGAFCKEAVKVEQANSRKLPSGFHAADAHTSLEKSSWGGGGRSCGLADKGRNEKGSFFPLVFLQLGLITIMWEEEIELYSLFGKEI